MRWSDKQHYDVLERGAWKHLHRVRMAYLLSQIAREKQLRGGESLRLLDVGCGDGIVTRRLRERFPDEAISGLDADDVRLNRARAYCPGVAFERGDIGALPYAEGAFEVVLCHHIIEHVADDAQVLNECYRVLAPGGLLILGIPHEGGAIGRILRALHRKMYAEGEHVNFYTIAGMEWAIRDQGFTGVHYAKFGFLFPQYHLHLLLTWNPLTFQMGHLISQHVDATADSLIFVARKPEEVLEWSR